MIILFYPDKDSTMYENYIDANSGTDASLEISHVNIDNELSVSRTLIDFSASINEIKLNVDSGVFPGNYTCSLQLYSSLTQEIPIRYSIECYPVYESWDMGTGRISDSPKIKNGVSWKYRDGSSNATTWSVDNLPTNVTCSYFDSVGGANWYFIETGSLLTEQIYNYNSSDINLDITYTVDKWLSGSINNNGLILKRTLQSETSDEYQGKLSFFSLESNTIYPPVLKFKYDDSVFVTGSLNPIPTDKDIIVYPINKKKYRNGEIDKVYVKSRLKYPSRTFTTQSGYTNDYYMPSSSYYQISDYITDDVIIDFDTSNTKISCDENGNYFYLRTDNFMLNRFYKISILVDYNDEDLIYDNEFIFKVVK